LHGTSSVDAPCDFVVPGGSGLKSHLVQHSAEAILDGERLRFKNNVTLDGCPAVIDGIATRTGP
jgi:hypothetical protein